MKRRDFDSSPLHGVTAIDGYFISIPARAVKQQRLNAPCSRVSPTDTHHRGIATEHYFIPWMMRRARRRRFASANMRGDFSAPMKHFIDMMMIRCPPIFARPPAHGRLILLSFLDAPAPCFPLQRSDDDASIFGKFYAHNISLQITAGGEISSFSSLGTPEG